MTKLGLSLSIKKSLKLTNDDGFCILGQRICRKGRRGKRKRRRGGDVACKEGKRKRFPRESFLLNQEQVPLLSGFGAIPDSNCWQSVIT